MGLSQEQRAAIDATKARIAEESVVVTKEYFGVEHVFRFKPVISQSTLKLVSIFQRTLADATQAEMFDKVVELLEVVLTMALDDGTPDLIVELNELGALGGIQLTELMQEAITAIAARPTMRSSSSQDGSPLAGPPSTAIAPNEVSIPLGSHSTAS
jgi:hypothetical protein